jgi:heme/copper-type cytochrome/quinol oxidase subunit 3
MDIPFTVKNRPDTGLYNGKLGVWLFLASEVMLFGGLFSAYIFLRTGVEQWPAGSEYLDIPLATLNTLFLITSSVTMVMSWASLKLNDFKKFKIYSGVTLLLALAFLVVKYFEYTHKFHVGYLPSTNNFLGIYFTMTGLHVLHIIGGMICIFYFWIPGAKMWEVDPERFTNRIEIVGLYWHFVDLVWIFLFPVLYLL